MWLKRLYLSYNDLVKVSATLLNAFDLDSGKRQSLHDLGDRLSQRQELFQPTDGELHLANWAKNRWSFSTSSRISGKPNNDIAKRSSPIPNAKPVHSSGSYALSPRLALIASNTAGVNIPPPNN